MRYEKLIDIIIFHVDNARVPVGTKRSHWYVGITDNPQERGSGHKVKVSNNGFFWHAGSESNARRVEKHILSLGFDGGSGGGKVPVYVYVFRKTYDTEPSLATFKGNPV